MAVTVEHVSPGFTFCVSVLDSEPPSLPSLMENVTVTPSASELDELERQAREAAAQAEEAAPGEGGAEITEIHGGPQEHDSEES